MQLGIRPAESGSGRLDSWKEIAAHLKRDVRTVQRWEHTKGLPVHRLGQGKRAPIYALRSELDSWASGAAESLSEEPARPRRHRLAFAAALLAVGLAGAFAGWWFTRSGAPAPSVKPLTTYPGLEWSPSFAPDGKQVTFLWNGGVEGKSGLYVKLASADANYLRLTAEGDIRFTAWNPDGRRIGFLRAAPGGCDVYTIPSLGGTPQRVGGPVSCLPLSWTPDGKWAVVSSERAVALVSIESGERRQITRPPAQVFGDSGGVVSPDGKHLAFMRQIADNVQDAYCLRLSRNYEPESEPRRLTNDNSQVGNLLWMPNSRELVYGTSRAGIRELWRISINGSGAQPIRAIGKIGAGSLALSPQGDKLVYPDFSTDVDLWRLDLTGGRDQAAARFASSTRNDGCPRFSPNGKGSLSRQTGPARWRSGCATATGRT